MKFDETKSRRSRWALAGAAASTLLLHGCGGSSSLPTTTTATVVPISANMPFALSDGASGDKPKIQRASDGTLVVVYGDAPDNSRLVYDVKAGAERPARDIFVKT